MISVILLLYLFLISFLLGEKLLGWFKVRGESFQEDVLLALGLGLGLLAYGTYLLGRLGLVYRPVLWIVTISLVFVFGKTAYSYIVVIYAKLADYFRTKGLRHIDAFPLLLLVLLLSHFVLNLISALAPEIGFDALWYHLSIPKTYVSSHKVFFIPHINVSGYPRMMEMLFTLGLGLGGEQLAKLIHFAAGVLSAAAMFVIGKRFLSLASTLLAVVVFYAMQPVNMLSGTADIDLGLTFFGLLALLLLMKAFEQEKPEWLVLSGIFAGWAMSTKYQGVFLAIALALTWVVFPRRLQTGKLLGLSIFGAAAALIFLPWPLDNIVNTGNPVYPLLNHFFGLGDSWERVVLASHTTSSWLQNHGLSGFLTLPWNLTMGSCDGWITPLLLILLPGSIFLKKKHWMFSFLLVFGLLFYMLLFLLPYWIVRFFVPLVPALALVVAYVWQELGSSDKVLLRFLNTVIALVVLANLGFLFLKSARLFPVSLGFERRDVYLSNTLGWYDVNRFVREKLPPKSKILVYGAQLFYYFDFDYLYNEPLNSRSAAQAARQLNKKGVRYVLLLVDKSGPQNLGDLKGFGGAEKSRRFELVYSRAMPSPAATNAARGAKLYAVSYTEK